MNLWDDNTPIEKAKNLGPQAAAELSTLGINSIEKFKELGWETVFMRLVEYYPNRLNINMASALIGAEENMDWRELPPNLKDHARRMVLSLKKKEQ